MKWSNVYATGIPRLDEQHQRLFQTSEDFRTALDHQEGERSYAMFLAFLESYCRAHFALEEQCMDQYRCAVAAQNKQAHEQMAELLAGYRQRHIELGYDSAVARQLIDALDDWLREHIGRVDVHLRNCVGGAGPTPAPDSPGGAPPGAAPSL